MKYRTHLWSATVNAMADYLFVLFLSLCLTELSSASPGGDFLTCNSTTGRADGIRFPFGFQRSDVQDGLFTLKCNNSQVVLPIPNFGDFLVRRINYDSHSISITDPGGCSLRLVSQDRHFMSPFCVRYTPFTFFHCPLNFTTKQEGAKIIQCLAGGNYLTVAILTSKLRQFQSVVSPCSHKHLAHLAPVNLLNSSDADLALYWDCPDCAGGDGTQCNCDGGSCSQPPPPAPTKESISKKHMVIIVVVVVLLSLPSFSVCWLVCADQVSRRNSAAEASPTASLDRAAVEVSYPMTELGGSMRLPNVNDTKCVICLADYEPKETVTTIPYCRHFFHSECINEWLKRNVSCPVCRREPEVSI